MSEDPAPRIAVRIHERLARLEAGYDHILHEVDGLRDWKHDISTPIQTLVTSAELASDQREALTRQIESLATTIAPLLVAAQINKGAWMALVKLGTVIVGLTSVVATIAGGLYWAWTHLTLK